MKNSLKMQKRKHHRRLYKLGYSREEIGNLFRFIDWVMWLPEELEPDFWDEITQIQESEDMEYISTGERVGYRRGYAEADLAARYQIIKNFIEQLFNLEDGELKKNIEERMALIDQPSELDTLISMLFMHPPLTSFMDYLPELDAEMVPS